MNKEKKSVLSGVFWKFSERMAAQIVSLVVSVILARLVLPSEYGVISLVTVFISISNVFVTSGFGTALVQKKNADDVDFSTVFYFSLVFTSLVYVVLFFCAEPLAKFYDMDILKPVFRVLSISVVIMGVNSVQQAYVSRKMMFKKFFVSTLIGTITSAVIGIVMAYRGFGVWALVAQTLTNNIMDTIILQITTDWRPIKAFSLKRLRVLFDYGWKLLLQSMVVQVYSCLRSLIIGKIYTPSDLAYYTKGKQFPDMICTNIDTALNAALFPAMSREQDSIDRVKTMARRTTRVSSYVLNPILIGFMAVAEPLVELLLTDKWLPAVPYLRICCVVLIFRAPETAMLQAIKSVGRSDSVLKMDFPIRVFAIFALIVSVPFGVIYFALSEIITTVFGMILYSVTARKVIGYTGKEVCEDFMPNTILATIMGVITWYVGILLKMPVIFTIFIQVIIGIVIYMIGSWVTKNDSLIYIINTIKEMKLKRRK